MSKAQNRPRGTPVMQQLRASLPRLSAAVCLAGSALLANASAKADVDVVQGGFGLVGTNVLFDQSERVGDLVPGPGGGAFFSSWSDCGRWSAGPARTRRLRVGPSATQACWGLML